METRKMRAAMVTRYGGAHNLVIGDAPRPVPGANDVLIEVHAAGVNPVDWKINDGLMQAFLSYPLPFIPGQEVAGVVVECGAEARRFRVGDRVYARLEIERPGGFAEFVCANEDVVARMPAPLSFVNAAGVPLVALTAWQALVDVAGVKPGSRVLIHAGSGGVGSWGIQIAKARGAFVATTTSARNVALVSRLGADQAIDYESQRFEQQVADVDTVLDTMGGEILTRSLAVLRPGGVLVTITGPAGQPDLELASQRSVRLESLFMRPRLRQLEQVTELIESGTAHPLTDRAFPLAQLAEALDYVRSHHARGKVVIKVK
jgi:NADPH:quinone reductase-like Zn-dependent oxidoreductase